VICCSGAGDGSLICPPSSGHLKNYFDVFDVVDTGFVRFGVIDGDGLEDVATDGRGHSLLDQHGLALIQQRRLDVNGEGRRVGVATAIFLLTWANV
jgi:hypothetical protein